MSPVVRIVQAYMDEALSQATLKKLDEGLFVARIPALKGVVAYGNTPTEAATELRSVLDDWVQLGLQLGHTIPVVGEVDLNTTENRNLALNY